MGALTSVLREAPPGNEESHGYSNTWRPLVFTVHPLLRGKNCQMVTKNSESIHIICLYYIFTIYNILLTIYVIIIYTYIIYYIFMYLLLITMVKYISIYVICVYVNIYICIYMYYYSKSMDASIQHFSGHIAGVMVSLAAGIMFLPF